MALKLWMGPSGSGKTRFLFEYVLDEAEKNKDINYLVIVPEQFTLSTQKELIKLSKEHGILNVDVLSFARLAYRIFEEVGFKNASGKAIDDMGKNLILRHLATKNDDKLKVLSGNMNKLGYITEVKSALSEFMQYSVSPDRITEIADNAKESGRYKLSEKLRDIETLYRLFYEYTEDKYITKEEILTKASKAAFKSEKLKKSVVVFDGFTGFTPVQYDLIESILQISRDIHVTILTDTRDKITYNTEHELFYLGYKTSEKLKKIAKLNNIRIDEDNKIIEDIPRRYLKNNTGGDTNQITSMRLAHLERNLFRDYVKAYNGDDCVTSDTKLPTKAVNSEIRVFSALQPIDEVTKVAVEIKKLIQNESFEGENSLGEDGKNKACDKIRYKDIAVAIGDFETYIPVISRVFTKYEIPFFIDKKQPVLLNPLIEYIRSMVDLISENFTYSAVFRMLRSPLSDYEINDIDRLENFVLKYGIRGANTWKQDWSKKYGRYFKKYDTNDENAVSDELILFENIRQKFMKEMKELADLITGDELKGSKKPTKVVNDINAVFMRTFETLNIEERINQLIEKYSITDETFEQKHKKEYEKVYSSVVELFERMDELLEGEEISYSEYGELLDAGFDEIRIGILPTITDYIQIGDLTRSRFNDIRTLFIVGANEGVIPKRSNGGGIISDIEKEFILEKTPDIELAPTTREQAYTGQLYLYMLMTKPTSQLILSYSRLNSLSEPIRPSYIIKVITDIFPDILIENDFINKFDKVVNKETGIDLFSENVKDESSITLLNVLSDSNCDNKTYSLLINIVNLAFVTGALSGSDNISKSVAQVLYGRAIIGSVTRLEQFARCAFSYFLKYGLTLKEREIFSFEAKDMGNIFHSLLEKYSSYVSSNKLDWADISESERDRIIEKALLECFETEDYSVLSSSHRNAYLIERIKRISRRSIDVLTEHLKAGDFTTNDAELSFGTSNQINAFTFKLSDDEIMKLSGKIDRLDTYRDTENSKLYIKVIDYKSGNKSFDLVEVYKGLSLQLVVYMNAAMELAENNKANAGQEIVPAGVLYYHIDDPLVDGRLSEPDEEISEKIIKELKMKGLVNSDKDILKHIDKEFEKGSDIIPVSYTTKGEISKTSSTATKEEFGIISEYVNLKIKELGREILSGNIKAEPHAAKGIDEASCVYCQYTDICKYSRQNQEAQEIKEKTLSKDDVIECMRQAIEDEKADKVANNNASQEGGY